MNLLWLLRMKRWVQHPPSRWRVLSVSSVVIACFTLVIVERTLGWPDWLTADPANGRAGITR